MVEISLHILDIVQNSIKADAENIFIDVFENTYENILRITVRDDGIGMPDELLKKVTNPFVTTNTLREAGFGLSLLKSACEMSGGFFTIDSQKGRGTIVTAEFAYNSLDRQPLGDMAFTVTSLLICNLNTRFVYTHTFNEKSFEFDSDMYSNQATDILRNGGSLSDWLQDLLNEKIAEIHN